MLNCNLSKGEQVYRPNMLKLAGCVRELHVNGSFIEPVPVNFSCQQYIYRKRVFEK